MEVVSHPNSWNLRFYQIHKLGCGKKGIVIPWETTASSDYLICLA